MSRRNESSKPRSIMPKLLQKITEYEAVAWLGAVVVGIFTFFGSTVWNVSSKNQLLESTKEQIAEVKSATEVAANTAQTAAMTAQSAATQVTHLQTSVAKADDKLDTIIEAQGRTAGQLDLLIQLQRNQLQAGMKDAKEPPVNPKDEKRFVQGPRVYTK